MSDATPHISTGTKTFDTISSNRGIILGDAYGGAQLIGSQTNYNVVNPGLQPSFFKTSNYESFKNFNLEPVQGTCRWFLDHQKFRKWRERNGADLLWLSADPGCGKSVLSRALIDQRLLGSDTSAVCHFFFKDNDEQDTITTALCALLHQLFCAREHLLEKHAALAEKRCGQALKNDFEELWKLFISAATDPSAGDVICILDALDECRPADRDKLIKHLTTFYSDNFPGSNAGSQLKFLVTSRHYKEIENGFRILRSQIQTIWLNGEEEQEAISCEIDLVKEVKLQEITDDRGLNPDTLSALHDRLSEIPNRTYLWLHLMLEEIKAALGNTKKKLLQTIDTLPDSIEEAYEKILTRCKTKKEAKTVLQIIVASQRPLTVADIDVALEIDLHLEEKGRPRSYADLDRDTNREDWIRKACGLFVTVVNSRVYLIHQTAREFLIHRRNEISGSQGWRHSIDLQSAHLKLAKVCISHLHFEEFKEDRLPHSVDRPISSEERSMAVLAYTQRFALVDYSASHWIVHAQESGFYAPSAEFTDNKEEWILKAAELCDIGDGWSSNWPHIYSLSPDSSHPFFHHARTRLYWSAVFRLFNVVQFFLRSGDDPDDGGDGFDTPLAATISLGYEDIVKLLLDSGATLDPYHNHFFEVACLGGHEKFLKTIFSFIPRALARDPASIISRVVEPTARYSRTGTDILDLLLKECGSQINITNKVVIGAASNELCGKETLQLLLSQRGSEIKITDEVIIAAAGNENNGKQILQFLLHERGSEFKITDQVVAAAARNGRGREILAFLLQKAGNEFEITESVLIAAASNERGGREILEHLLQKRGSEFKITDEVVAATVKNLRTGERILELLLQKREKEIKITRKVVVAAITRGGYEKENLRFLLQNRGSEAEVTDEAIRCIAEEFDGEMMRLLLGDQRTRIEITEDMVTAAAGNLTSGRQILTIMSEKDPEMVHDTLKTDINIESQPVSPTQVRFRFQGSWVYVKGLPAGDRKLERSKMTSFRDPYFT